ncbi:MAG: hypothetical protein U0610_02695 [bacterium]
MSVRSSVVSILVTAAFGVSDTAVAAAPDALRRTVAHDFSQDDRRSPVDTIFADDFETMDIGAWGAYAPAPVLANASFDLGHVAWTESSTFFPGELLVQQGDGGAPAAHTGSWLAWLGGANGEIGDLSQTITVPPGTPPSYLFFRYQINSDETNCSQVTPADAVRLFIDAAAVDGIVICSSFNTGTNWIEYYFLADFSAYAGQTVTPHIQVTNDGNLTSSFFLDSLRFRSVLISGLSEASGPMRIPSLHGAVLGGGTTSRF